MRVVTDVRHDNSLLHSIKHTLLWPAGPCRYSRATYFRLEELPTTVFGYLPDHAYGLGLPKSGALI